MVCEYWSKKVEKMNSDKLDLKSPDLVNENFEKLAELFPNCVTEGPEGKAIDFDLLKQELNHAVVEGNKERYRLEWPGKREAIVTANLPTTKTLRPVREDSVDFDNTENIYIEGDNLEALKLLQESYLGKIKMIYIDPPYNTGKDFVYKDNFSKDAQEELIDSGQKDEYNQRLVANPETAGRYHSDWLSMMYPRLKLARNLLTDDGVIFISIDDNEASNLRKIGDEVFGEINFESQIAWRRRHNQPNDKSKMIAKVSENILVYAKNSQILKERKTYYGLPLSEKRISEYTNPDNDPKGKWTSNPWKAAIGRGGSKYKLETINGTVHDEVWYGSLGTFKEHVKEGRVHWTDGGSGFPRIKIYVDEAKKSGQAGINFFTHHKFGSNQDGSLELQKIMGQEGLFDNPKPLKLLKSLIKLATLKDGDIILDFFSGSGGIGQAVYQLNQEEKTNRQFILVQLPENLNDSLKSADSTSKRTIENAIKFLKQIGKPKILSEIGKERIRRAAKKIKEETGADIDYGFRVYRLDSSNMQDVYYTPQDYDQGKLDFLADNVKPDRTADDLLAQVMLDWGLPLSLKIEQAKILGKKVFKVAENSLYACFDEGIDEDFAKEIAKDAPLRVVFKDSGFKNDTAKTNVKQLLKQLSPETEMKVF